MHPLSTHEAVNLNIRKAIGTIEQARSASHSIERHQQGLVWSKMFANGMGVDIEAHDLQAEAAGERLGILNVLYEKTPDENSARFIHGELMPALDPYLATTVLNEPLRGEDDYMGAARNQLALITATGIQRLRDVGNYDLADKWSEEWESSVIALCQAENRRTQYRQGSISPNELDGIGSLTEGINKYLELFGRTGAVELSFMGNFPFIQKPNFEKLEETKKLAIALTPIMRLMQDVKLDLNESLNAGIFAHAALNKLSLKESRYVLTSSEQLQNTIKDELEDRLAELMELTLPKKDGLSEYSAGIMKAIEDLRRSLS